MTRIHSKLHLYACLPFVELSCESVVSLGPVTFWPASDYRKFLDPDSHKGFLEYVETFGQIKARLHRRNVELVNTVKLTPAGTTFISVSEDVPEELRDFILADSLYLLYFACTFRNLYYGNEVPSFNAFRKMIPASLDFIDAKKNWENLYIDESLREETVCVNFIDPEICKGLGAALSSVYVSSLSQNPTIVQSHKRLVRSVRYFTDRFSFRFVNLFGKGLDFPEALFEPEDVIFLASSFEVLFDIDDRNSASDFKHKLRPFLHLKYGGPVEIFWNWIDDFYKTKREIVRGGLIVDPTFRLNPNFEVSHLFIGIKLFIYSVYYMLYKFRLLSSTYEDPYTPPDFKWIHPEEILLFFWTEPNVLNKLNTFIGRALRNPDPELVAEIHQLTGVFVSVYERYYMGEVGRGVVFIPSKLEELKASGSMIIDLLKAPDGHSSMLQGEIHPRFISRLESRLREVRENLPK